MRGREEMGLTFWESRRYEGSGSGLTFRRYQPPRNTFSVLIARYRGTTLLSGTESSHHGTLWYSSLYTRNRGTTGSSPHSIRRCSFTGLAVIVAHSISRCSKHKEGCVLVVIPIYSKRLLA